MREEEGIFNGMAMKIVILNNTEKMLKLISKKEIATESLLEINETLVKIIKQLSEKQEGE